MYRLVAARIHDEGCEHHTFIPVEQGKYHVEMYERLRGMRQLLYDDMLCLFAFPVYIFVDQHVDGLCAGACSVPDQ